MTWQPIETAPKDGRPVWVKGDNYGNPMDGQHCCWAWWDGHSWLSDGAGADGSSELLYLVSWLPMEAA